jgi:dTDP-glucose 4,6-dehydratase
MNVLVTGGCGFIGSNFIRRCLEDPDVNFVVNVDALTYAGNMKNVEPFLTNRKYSQHISVSIGNYGKILNILEMNKISHVVNFAAETHVDNSIKDPRPFIETNIVSTTVFLSALRDYWKEKFGQFMVVHVSTDEVYGALEGKEGKFTLNMPYKPNSPYSATKAAGDMLCRAWHKTYGLPITVTNCCNNYGPNQHKEKLIPLTISRLMKREKIPVYGKGENIREWIYVDDHCDAVKEVMKRGNCGDQYLIGSGFEMTNIDLVKTICDTYDVITGNKNSQDLISFVTDRPGHDFRYSIESHKIRIELDWYAKVDFKEGLTKTIKHYLS